MSKEIQEIVLRMVFYALQVEDKMRADILLVAGMSETNRIKIHFESDISSILYGQLQWVKYPPNYG